MHYTELEFSGKDLIGLEYDPLFNFPGHKLKSDVQSFHPALDGRNVFTVLDGEGYVTAEDGTGVLHVAPGFGEEDYEICKKNDIGIFCPMDDAGCSTIKGKIEYQLAGKNETLELFGRQVFDTNDDIIKYLKSQNLWIATEQYLHNYPHCWRTDTPLVYRAISSWYVKVTDFKDRMVELNKKINWIPEHVKDGQMGKWLENARDWSISRNRFWGCPVPVWKSPTRQHVFGSIAEMESEFRLFYLYEYYVRQHKVEYSEQYKNYTWKYITKDGGFKIDDLHRPYIDELRMLNFASDKEQYAYCIAKGFAEKGDLPQTIIEDVIEGLKRLLRHDADDNGYYHVGVRGYSPSDELHFENLQGLLTLLENNVDGYGDWQFNQDFSPEEEGQKVAETEKEKIEELKNSEIKTEDLISRVEDVLDCWFESGSMPFASVHYPFNNEEYKRDPVNFKPKDHPPQNLPADFITEYIAQTRGWFYTLIVLSTALFDNIPFKNVICHGVVLDEKSQKLSKRLRNYPDPLEMFDKYGSDAMRWTLLRSNIMRGGNFNIDKNGDVILESVKNILNPIWNAAQFFFTYATIDNVKITHFKPMSEDIMDKYIISKFKLFINNYDTYISEYKVSQACNEVELFIDTLNNWYIRRTKDRFWRSGDDENKQDAYKTLFYVLENFCIAVSPLLPFLTDKIYEKLQHFK